MKAVLFLILALQPVSLFCALQEPRIEHFTEKTYANFQGDSHHHYYANRHVITRAPGIRGSIAYAIEFGVLEFISETITTSLRAALRRLVPKLYTDSQTLETKKRLLEKAEHEKKLTALAVQEKEQKLLAQTSALIAENQKQIAALKEDQPLLKERLINQNIELLEAHTRRVLEYVRGRS